MLDPTLLLNKEDYIELFSGKNLPSNKGVYTYILDSSDWKDKVVEAAKIKFKLPQFSNQHSEQAVNSKRIPSIEGWLKGFADADFIVTDSFHGTVFSIIFNKPFISLVNINRGASRFESILGEFDLMQRLASDFDQQHIEALIEEAIVYDGVNQKRDALRSHSKEVLKAALSAF